ncbi:MAG: MarR family transcriptional regulator [Herpetosiphonaceae bacterium]|nr:MarR family transcriptional regulator [Herpetosiphonaceae bacterium]
MSSPPIPADKQRTELVSALRRASRENSNVAVMLHTAIGARMGLGATEEKTLGILEQHGPLTAGDLAEHTGLAGASVTNLLDRLEKKGFVRRVRDTADRRRVIVELNRERMSEFGPLFADLEAMLDDLMVCYTNEQLGVILDFVERATRRSHEEIGKLAMAPEA